MAKIQHVVLLKFKPEIGAAQIAELFAQLAGLKQKIAGIEYFAGGAYSSDEGLNQGFTHGFVMTFSSVADRDAYLPHPEHEKVKGAILPTITDVIAFDFKAV